MLWAPRQQTAGLQFWLQCPPEQLRIRAPESGRLSKNPCSATGSLCDLKGESLNHSKSSPVHPFHKYSLNVIFGPNVIQGHSSAHMRPVPVRPAHQCGLVVRGRQQTVCPPASEERHPPGISRSAGDWAVRTGTHPQWRLCRTGLSHRRLWSCCLLLLSAVTSHQPAVLHTRLLLSGGGVQALSY